MLDRLRLGTPRRLSLEAFGVPFSVRANPRELVPAIRATLPPAYRRYEGEHPQAEFTVERFRDGYEVTLDDVPLAHGLALKHAMRILGSQIRMVIAEHAPEFTFIHAGAVAIGDAAILVPGKSFAGKTTLVTELIGRGAVYLSDEFALLDGDGAVHPYPKPLSIRPGAAALSIQQETAASAFGASTGFGSYRLAVIAALRYDPLAGWSPHARSPAQGAVILMANAPAAQTHTERVLAAVRRASAHAIVLEGDRGEASDAAGPLLALVQPSPAAQGSIDAV